MGDEGPGAHAVCEGAGGTEEEATAGGKVRDVVKFRGYGREIGTGDYYGWKEKQKKGE